MKPTSREEVFSTGSLFSTSVLRPSKEERIVFSTKAAGETGHPHVKE